MLVLVIHVHLHVGCVVNRYPLLVAGTCCPHIMKLYLISILTGVYGQVVASTSECSLSFDFCKQCSNSNMMHEPVDVLFFQFGNCVY